MQNFYRKIAGVIVSMTCFIGSQAQTSPCTVISVLDNPNPAPIYSPDSTRYLINMQDTAGVFQVYVGHTGDTNVTCITLVNPWSLWRPWADRNKFMAQWDPTGNFIICGVEKEFYNELLYVPYNIRLGLLESGIWLDIMACTPDGATWYNLATTVHGYTGCAFTPNGTRCAWAEAQDSANLSVDVFGLWKLQLSDYAVVNGTPTFTSTTDITPAGARWIEPGNIAPDGVSLLVSSDIGMTNAEGQDQFIVNISNGQVTNLNNTPMVWDEHGFWSPDGSKILFMSSYPYQADTNSYHTLTIKTEFMLMDPNGSNIEQLTHFCDTGYYESGGGIAACGFFGRGDSTIYCQSLLFPLYNDWKIKFAGDCGYTPVGIEETNEEAGIKVYPDPASDYVILETQEIYSSDEIMIMNSLGQEVRAPLTCYGSKYYIDISGLNAGVYFIQVHSGDTSFSSTFAKSN